MKLDKAKSQWISDRVSDAMKKEEEALKAKREKLRQLCTAFEQLRETQTLVIKALDDYLAATGESKKSVLTFLGATPGEQRILTETHKTDILPDTSQPAD